MWTFAWVAGPLLVVGIAAQCYSCAVRRWGVRTTATVTGTSSEIDSSGDGVDECDLLHVRYRDHTRDAWVDTRFRLPTRTVVNAFEIGDDVEILYPPWCPRAIGLADHEERADNARTVGVISTGIGFTLTIIGLCTVALSK